MHIPAIIGICVCLLIIVPLVIRKGTQEDAYTTESAEFREAYENARRYAAANDYTRAIRYFTEALKIRPENAEVHNDLGATYLNMGVKASEPPWEEDVSDMTGFEAFRQLEQALAQAESDIIIFEKADQRISDALVAQARKAGCGAYIEPHQLTATITIIKGKTKDAFRKAESELVRAKDLKPRYAVAYQNLGNLYYRMGHHRDAKILWQNALKLEPHNKELRRYLQANFPEILHEF